MTRNNHKNSITRKGGYIFGALLFGGIITYILITGGYTFPPSKKAQEAQQIYTNNNSVETQQSPNRSIEYNSRKIQSDDSLLKYVSPDIAFSDTDYIPSGLTSIEANQYILLKKGSEQLREEALIQLKLLAKDFYTTFQKPIIIVSAYRNFSYQQKIEENSPKCIADKLCAKAGHSEHQGGLAIDIFDASDEKTFLANKEHVQYYAWIKENAHMYGFTQSYQKGSAIDGYEIEPWHWRYVGVELATLLHEQGITLSEWYAGK